MESNNQLYQIVYDYYATRILLDTIIGGVPSDNFKDQRIFPAVRANRQDGAGASGKGQIYYN